MSGEGRSVLQQEEDGWEDRGAALDLLLKEDRGRGRPTQRTGISELTRTQVAIVTKRIA
jgi:hypothetical protein